ncbi:MAG: FkbM family methyltransferase [Chloroflexi bacterium]|nr:FkbM family methyltransferase [Chloroflexota bacterium]
MMNILNKIQKRFGRSQDFNVATIDDVVYCYRLFLNREPDEIGMAYWTDLVKHHHIPLTALCDGFLGSHEFKNLVAERNKPHLIELPDFKIYVRLNDHFIGGTIANTGDYEPYVTQELRRLLKPGMTFLDVGANIGYFTLLAATLVGKTGKVLAFEPQPSNCKLLEESMAANGLQNIALYPYAAAEKAQTLIFTGGGADSNGRIVNPTETLAQEQDLPTIEAVRLDDSLADIERLDVVKMDIEGAEPRAWEGMQRLIQKHRPIVLMEFAPDLIRVTSGTEPSDLLDSMQKWYDIYILKRSGGKSDAPQSAAALMQAQADSTGTHLDIVAYPRQ